MKIKGIQLPASQNGIYEIITITVLRERGAHATSKKLIQQRACCGAVILKLNVPAIQIICLLDQWCQRDTNPCLLDNSDDTEGCTPQRKRILRAAGNRADPKIACQRIDLIRQGQRSTGHCFWQSSTGGVGAVLLTNGFGNRRIFPVADGVMTTHHALQFRKLKNHVRDQIRLT